MANDQISVRITADDKQFQSAMQRVQATAKSSREKISVMGSSVASVGTQFGALSGKVGGTIAGLSNFVGVIGQGGAVGLALTALSVGIGVVVKKYTDMKEASRKAGHAAIDSARAQVKAQEALFESWRKEGMSEGEQMINKLAKERIDAINRGQNVRAAALLEEIHSWKRHEEEAKWHRENAKEMLAIAAAELELAKKEKKATGVEDPWALDFEAGGAERAADAAIAAREQQIKEEEEAAALKWQMEFEALEERNRAEAQAHDDRMREIQLEADARREALKAEQEAELQRHTAAAEYWAGQGVAAAQFASQLIMDDRATNEEKVKAGLEYLSQMAIGEGAIMAIKGAGMMVASPAAGAPYLAAGLALMGLGMGGMAGAAGIAGAIAGTPSTAGTGEASTTRAPTTSIGPGTATRSSEPTIINYYFGGPVFGNEDDAARAVTHMNERGRRLEGWAS